MESKRTNGVPQPPPPVTQHISSMDRNHAGVFPCCWEPPFWNVLQRSFGLTFGPLLWTHSHGCLAASPWSYTPCRRDVARSISTWWQGLWVASIPQEEWAEVCTCSVQFEGSPSSGLIFSLLDGPVASFGQHKQSFIFFIACLPLEVLR